MRRYRALLMLVQRTMGIALTAPRTPLPKSVELDSIGGILQRKQRNSISRYRLDERRSTTFLVKLHLLPTIP
jgi:hypothetical protein